MIKLLDYILDESDNFWIVNAIYDKEIYGYMVYQVDNEGERYNNVTKKYYKKNNSKKLITIPKYKKVFCPKKFYINNKDKLTGIWKKYVEVLNEIGIKDKDIGIFGSYLIGFDIIKDVDFAIYGINNLKKYLKNKDYINKKLGVTNITEEHINYQCDKFKDFFDKKMDIKKIISRNISGIQVKNGVLSTPRFIDTKKIIIPKDNGSRKEIKIKVIDSLKTSMFPRRAKVIYNNEEYDLITPIWKYESFLRNNDSIIVRGNIFEKERKIVLYDYEDYVYFL